MKAPPKKTIKRGTYLQALALFTMADRHYQKARGFELELLSVLGIEENDHMSDEIYSLGVGDFDDALARSGIVLSSADSVNVARNYASHEKRGEPAQCPEMMARTIDSVQPPLRWVSRPVSVGVLV